MKTRVSPRYFVSYCSLGNYADDSTLYAYNKILKTVIVVI